MPDMAELVLFPNATRWVLLEGAAEIGSFASEAEALEAARRYVLACGEPRHLMHPGPDGWEEELIRPAASH